MSDKMGEKVQQVVRATPAKSRIRRAPSTVLKKYKGRENKRSLSKKGVSQADSGGSTGSYHPSSKKENEHNTEAYRKRTIGKVNRVKETTVQPGCVVLSSITR